MADDLMESNAGGTRADGTIPRGAPTAPHAPLPNAPTWYARAAQQPATSLSVVGVLALAIVQAVGVVRGDDLEQELQDRIEQVEEDKEKDKRAEDLAANAKTCADAAKATTEEISKLRGELRAHADEQLEFQSELAQWTQRSLNAFGAKLKVKVPPPGNRFNEYVVKGFARAARGK